MTAGDHIRVLLVDDDEGAFVMTRAMLGQIRAAEFELDWVSTAVEGDRIMAKHAHDVYLVDYMIDEDSGIDLVREARDKGLKAPVILLTGKGSHQVDVAAMEAGVSDYLEKTKVDPGLLERSIRYAMDRVRSEAALRESEERHRSMFDHLPIGLYRTSVDGQLLDANPALVQMLGHPDRNTLEFDYARNFFVSSKHRQRFLDRVDQFGVVRGFESELQRPDGTRLWVRTAARAHRATDGTTVYFEGAVEDVSDRHEARDVRGRAAGFQWIFDQSGVAMILLERDGVIREANPAFVRIFGYAEDELIGDSYFDLVDPDDRSAAEQELRQVSAGAADATGGERRLLAADGEHMWARTRTGLIRDREGLPDHVVVLLEDVSEA